MKILKLFILFLEIKKKKYKILKIQAQNRNRVHLK